MSSPIPPAPPPRKWTDAQREEVKAMLAHGATASMVARAMQLGRNAVLGRIWRDPDLKLLGYSGRTKKLLGLTPFPKHRPRHAKAIAATVSPAGDAPVKPVPVCKPVASHPMALIGTGTRWCKWPVASDSRVLGGFLCCGGRSLPGDVYCEKHRALARQAARVLK